MVTYQHWNKIEMPEELTVSTISKEHEIVLLQQMKLIRRFEEKAAEMYSKSKIRGFLHLCIGEEAVPVGIINSLSQHDYILCTYREHGHALARGISSGKVMAEMFGKIQGCCKGRGGSMHLFDKSKNFFGGNAIVGGHLPMAVGMALAQKKQKADAITCCFFGEGAVAEGEFHEAMNLAALWKLPVLMVCENNQYAMGTAIQFTHASIDIAAKGRANGIESMEVDGMDVKVVENAAKFGIGYIRTHKKPFFLICQTYRFRAHSMFDAELYRSKAEVEEWKRRDPIILLQNELLLKNQITVSDIKMMDQEIEAEINAAVDFAEAGTYESTTDLSKYTYSEI
jgi:pyruvate dehydrogenase E1 component alpha subunit